MAGTSQIVAQDSTSAQPTALKQTTNSLWTMLTTLLSGENQTLNRMQVVNNNSYSNITSGATTVVKSAAGHLHSITVNATAAGTITIYDNTAASGTKIGTLKASIVEGTYTFDVAFATGLTIVTGAASDITVSYL